ncbi:3-phosphoshikimate 1-carboxyvinyltransferase [Lysobacteraceae bacterium NML75-0749]|nr:3-phosphoshikimate 1-carboxyvinyltransferase [Xanthomonadaceae bacterium NML75-0749]PJK05674.1 3-phosphoshikimate 1-carboxyvinyltransferase [Xanthomonadaceae bacterium NML91-0268]
MPKSHSSVWLASAPLRPLQGEIRVPGDKSISHRAIMLAALADGVSHIKGFLEGEDTRATARIFQQLGVRIDMPADGERIVHGVGIDGLKAPPEALDCGNSGTAMRLLAGLLAAQPFACQLIGDESLGSRPMRRVSEPLAQMGADIRTAEAGRPPLSISPIAQLQGMDYASPVASAQVKSAVLLAGLQAAGETCVREPHPTRDYTERMLHAFGVAIEYRPGFARICGGQRLAATDIEVPGDFSSAAFALVAASLIPGSDITLHGIGIDPRRTGLLQVLQMMGADIALQNRRQTALGEVASLRVRHAPLHGIEVPMALVPDMIDEFPVCFAAAACARGTTRIRGAAELRVKESDRIRAMAEGLCALGIAVDETPDGADIHGGPPVGGEIHSLGDHRIAMSFAVLAQCAKAEVRIVDTANVATSYPGFVAQMQRLGFALQEV